MFYINKETYLRKWLKIAKNIKTSIIRKKFDANSFEAGAGRTNQLDMRKQFTADRKKKKELWR